MESANGSLKTIYQHVGTVHIMSYALRRKSIMDGTQKPNLASVIPAIADLRINCYFFFRYHNRVSHSNVSLLPLSIVTISFFFWGGGGGYI